MSKPESKPIQLEPDLPIDGLGAMSPDNAAKALQWVKDDDRDPSWAAADWLAHDIDPTFTSAVALLADPNISVDALDLAKDAFKTLRVVGERSEDRRLGARLYLAAIAAALARHNRRITRQSDETLSRSLREMVEDDTMPGPLRAVAGMALCAIEQKNGTH